MMLLASLLLSITACAQAIVVPRTVAVPENITSAAIPYEDITTAFPPGPTVLANPSCPINCSYYVQPATSYTWVKISATTTVTHAIEYVIVNNRTNTTRTSTSYMELPANVTIPPTNSLGTRVWPMTISSPVAAGTWSTFVTNITYPASFTQYPSAYTWWGAASTTNTAASSVCAWEPYYWSGSNIRTYYGTEIRSTALKSCPPGESTRSCTMLPPYTKVYMTITADSWRRMASGSSVTFTSVNEFGSTTSPVDPEDPRGYLYVIGLAGPQVAKGMTVSPSPPGNMDAIWSQCTRKPWVPNPSTIITSGVEPVGGLATAYFLTETSTLHEDSAPTTTSAPDLGSLLVSTASSGASATVDHPSATASPTTTDSEKSTSAAQPSSTVDGVTLSSPSGAPASTTEDVSLAFPSPAASATNTGGFDLGPAKPTNSEPQTIDIGPSTAESAQAGTPSVSGEGFESGFGPQTSGPTLVLTEVSGSFVLSTVAPSSAPVTTASATTKLVQPESPAGTTAPSEPESPEHTSAASEPGLPVVTTAAPQEHGSTAIAASPTPIEVGGITVSQNSDTHLIAGSQTLAAGSSIIVGSGSSTTAVALQTDGSSTHIVVGTATAAVPSPVPAEPVASAAPTEPFEVGGITASQNSASEIVVGTQTLAPGSSIVVGSGSSTTAVALQTDDGTTHLVVGSSTAAIPTPATPANAPPAPFTVAGVTVSQNSASHLVIGSQTLAPGSSIIVGSGSSTTAVALHTEDGTTQLVVGTSTAAVPAASPSSAAAAAPIVYAGQTLTPGSTLTIGSGTQTTALVLSTNAAGDSSAIVVADASTTYTVDAPAAATPTTTTGAHLITTGATTELVVAGSTYTFKTGGPSIGLVTAGGTTFVVAGGGSSRTSIPIPTGSSANSASSSSSSGTSRTTASSSGGASSSGLGGGVGWATGTGSSANASSTGGAAAVGVDGFGAGLMSVVCAALGVWFL